jgi:hypothetical protein
VAGLWVGLVVALWVGSWVGCGAGGADVGGGGATVGVGGPGVGVFWVGAATTGDRSVPPDPAALCGHQAIRHAARPSDAAEAKRKAFVQVELTTSSLAPGRTVGPPP